MMKYPIGIQSFDKIIEDGYIYVDKTELIYQLVKDGTIYFLSRPRRFGKSLLVSTLKCYFQGRKELFKGLAIDKLETEWAEYPVFHIDFNGTDFTKSGKLEDIVKGTVSTWEKEYGRTEEFEDIGRRFAYVLQQAHKRYGRRDRRIRQADTRCAGYGLYHYDRRKGAPIGRHPSGNPERFLFHL